MAGVFDMLLIWAEGLPSAPDIRHNTNTTASNTSTLPVVFNDDEYFLRLDPSLGRGTCTVELAVGTSPMDLTHREVPATENQLH